MQDMTDLHAPIMTVLKIKADVKKRNAVSVNKQSFQKKTLSVSVRKDTLLPANTVCFRIE